MKLNLSLVMAALLLLASCNFEEIKPGYPAIEYQTYTYAPDPKQNPGTDVYVYPNPFIEHVTIYTSSSESEHTNLYISDEKGKYGKKVALPNGNGRVDVRFRNMPKAIYMLEVHQGKKVSKYRLLKTE